MFNSVTQEKTGLFVKLSFLLCEFLGNIKYFLRDRIEPISILLVNYINMILNRM